MDVALRFFIIALAFSCFTKAQDLNTPTKSSYGDALQLVSFRGQRRKTIDGRLCAAAFVFDGKTYTDCTDSRGPDQTTGREWCFVEVSLLGKGPKDWNFCAPSLQYDKLRAKLKEAFQIKSSAVEKMSEELDRQVQRLEGMVQRYNTTCGVQHDSTRARIEAIENMISQSHYCVTKIEKTISKVGLLSGAISQAEDDLHKSIKTLSKRPENCEATRGYEDDPYPDGLRAAYYNNAIFNGPPKKYRDDKNINFVFSGASDIEGITFHQFSIRWDGYILIPHTGKYIFSTESTCGSRVFLNDNAIIVDRMPEPQSLSEAKEDSVVPLINADKQSGLLKVESKPQHLVGGQKYKIRVEMFHSSYQLYHNPYSSSMKLLWRSFNIAEEVIPPNYFFKSNSRSPIKVSGLKANEFEVDVLINGVKAHKDDNSHLIADVPPRFEGRKMIRSVFPFVSDTFSIELNVPAVVYIASPLHDPPSVVPTEDHHYNLHNTNEVLSIQKETLSTISAASSTVLGIKFIEVREDGNVCFQVLNKDKPFVLFVEPKRESDRICGGEEEVLSNVNGPYLEYCATSSEVSKEYGCNAAFSGMLMDKKNGMWKTASGNGIGEYIIAKFKNDVKITEVRFKPKDDEMTWPSEIALTFSDQPGEDTHTFNVRHVNSIELNTFQLKSPVITNYLKIEVTQMYTKLQDTGGAFEVIGAPCHMRDSSLQGTQIYQEVTVDNEHCFKTIENIPEILPLEEGEEFIVNCPSNCISRPEGTVYGHNGVYSPASALCASAVHANVCDVTSKRHCRVLVIVGGPKPFFNGGHLNEISSYPSGPSAVSIKLFKAPVIEDISVESFFVTFQKPNSMLPKEIKYLFDQGEVKRAHGNYFYGWFKPAKLETCTKPSKINPLFAGGVEFPPATGSVDCTNNVCDTNFWSMSLPEGGKYRVEVQVGSNCASNPRIYYLQINGVPTISGVALNKGEYHWATVDVNLVDKKLMLTSICDAPADRGDLCVNAITTIMNLKIQKVAE